MVGKFKEKFLRRVRCATLFNVIWNRLCAAFQTSHWKFPPVSSWVENAFCHKTVRRKFVFPEVPIELLLGVRFDVWRCSDRKSRPLRLTKDQAMSVPRKFLRGEGIRGSFYISFNGKTLPSRPSEDFNPIARANITNYVFDHESTAAARATCSRYFWS